MIARDVDLDEFVRLPSPDATTAESVARLAPDRLLAAGTPPAARAALWWRNVPRLAGERLGLVGLYASTDAAAASVVLEAAARELAARGATLAVGPMDGSTWSRYRFVTDAGSAPPFVLEPWNPPTWPAEWERAGFAPLARYLSAAQPLARVDEKAAAAEPALARDGYAVRAFRPDDARAELDRLYDLSSLAFRDNYLATPIERAAFRALYEPILPAIDPRLVLLAEHGGRAVGIVFALPDHLQRRRGEPLDTIVVKTLAVHPDHQERGLGAVLARRCQEAARALGFRTSIHALMHETNASARISARTGEPLRRYALLGRRL